MNKRYLNVRPIFVSFLGLMAGIGISFLFLTQKLSGMACGVIAFFVLALAIAMVLYAECTKEHNSHFRARKTISPMFKISGFMLMGSLVIGMLLSIFPICKIVSPPVYYDKTEMTGVVTDYVVAKEKYTTFILTDCRVDDRELGFDVLIYTSSFAKINLGDKLCVVANLDNYLIDDKYGLSSLVDGVGYSAYVDLSSLTVLGNEATIKDKIKDETFEILQGRLSDDNADIMYSIIFGESGSIDKTIKSQFSYAGISHMLAVSGLHVSVLFGLICFILNKFKISPKFSLVILFCILLGYSYLCSFSPSVCRASIMTMVTLICSTFKLEHDGICSLSIAGIIILCISPLQFFSISFRLSFLCVFAIITLSPTLGKIFKKWKVPAPLAETLALSISISVVTLPVMMNAFEEVSLLGVITNVFVIPLFSILYTLTLVIVVLSFAIRPLSVLLYFPNIFLHLIRVIADYICKIPFAVFKAFNVGYIMIFGIASICMVANFLMTTTKTKVLISLSLVALICSYTCLEMLPSKIFSNHILVYYSGGDSIIYYLDKDGVTLIGSDFKKERLSSSLKDMRSYTIRNIVAYDFALNKLDDLAEICDYYEVENVFLPKDFEGLNGELPSNVVVFDNNFQVGNLTIEMPDYYSYIPVLHLEVGDVTALIVGDLTNAEKEFVESEYSFVNYAISDEWDSLNFERVVAEKIILTKVLETSVNNVLNLKVCGKIKIEVGV